MARTIDIVETAVKDHAENSGGGTFSVLPAGEYEFTVKDVKEGPAAKSGANASKSILNAQLRIVDDAPVGKGRVFFKRVPLFQAWAPSEKSPQGATAHDHFQFYEGLGYDVSKGILPDDKELLGKRITGKLVVKKADDFHDEPYNEVTSLWASKSKGKPSAVADIAGDVWATPAAAAPATDAWAPAPADVQYAQSGKAF